MEIPFKGKKNGGGEGGGVWHRVIGLSSQMRGYQAIRN